MGKVSNKIIIDVKKVEKREGRREIPYTSSSMVILRVVHGRRSKESRRISEMSEEVTH